MSYFKTLATKGRAELKVRGSRFIGTAIVVGSREDAAGELALAQKEFRDATHNCYAWRLAPYGLEYRFSDDGELVGAAGKPILFVLQQHEVVNALIIVTRYFGGTKLGVGGLARAYAETAAAALKCAGETLLYNTLSYRILATYEDIRAVRPLVRSYALSFEEEFLDVVHYVVDLRVDQIEEFRLLLTNISQGRAGMVRLDAITDGR